MTPPQQFLADTFFRISSLDVLGILDILLVVLVIFSLLLMLRRSRAASLLRGMIILVLALSVVTILLPLPAFDWVVRMFLFVVLVTTPILLQPELRRLLENLGRSAGLSRSVRQTTAESVVPQLLRTLENLSTTRTGMLLALEGSDSLQDVMHTGVPIHGRVSTELLQTIFFDKTPLHDGAVIVRGDQVMAAGCLLPLTEQPLPGRRRYGTRHRAAVGLSEKSDAFVLIVSEETGLIAVARHNRLHPCQEISAIRQQLYEFYAGDSETDGGFSWRGLWAGVHGLFANDRHRSWMENFLSLAGLLTLSVLFALAAWSFAIEQTNPTERPVFEDVPLRLESIPDGLVLMNKPQTSVAIQVQAAADVLQTLDQDSFQATASLAGLEDGIHQVTVNGKVSVTNARIISLDPAVINVELVKMVSITMPVTIELTDQTLSSAYQMVESPVALPAFVTVTGPELLVNQVSQVQATLALNNASSSLQEIRPLHPLDADGEEVSGITLSPTQAQVSLLITRKQNAREVGVRVLTEGPPPDGYWLSRLSVIPANVTLQGDTAVLREIGSFVDTLPVNIRQATGPYTEITALNLPDGVEAIDSNGHPVRSVTVTAEISPRSGDISLTRRVEIFNAPPNLTITIAPEEVDLLLSGPLPMLHAMAATPGLVRVYIDASDLRRGQRVELTPVVVYPVELSVQLVPATISVTTK